MLAGDEAAVRGTVTTIGTDTERARDALDGPHWWVAAHLPWIGTNAEALQTVTEVADDLSHQALPELTSAAEVLEPSDLKPKGGKVALEPIRKVQPLSRSRRARLARLTSGWLRSRQMTWSPRCGAATWTPRPRSPP